MYELRPPAVYAHESVIADPRWEARLDRVVGALAEPVEVQVYRDEDLPAMIRGGLLAARAPMGTLDPIPDPILLFNTFRFDGRRARREAELAGACQVWGYHTAEALAGYGPFDWFPAGLPEDPRRAQKVCRPCWRAHFQNGCAHKCHYCGLGGLLVTMVNVEDYLERFDRLIAAHPWQETYLLEDDADVLCLEPELGCLGPILEHFGTLKGRYAILHTKSANVDWMLDLRHNGNTIIVWSLAGATQAERFEPVCGSTEERIDAARKVQAAGYTVRYKFKPIIPVRDWRRDAAEAVRMIFERTRPDVISLSVFMWMNVEEMKRRLDPSLLDPDCLAAAEHAAPEIGDAITAPFPPQVRAEIYEHYIREIRKHDPQVPISLSTESPEMWKRLGPRLGAEAWNYVCGCGPNSTPGRKKLACSAFEIAAAGPVGEFNQM
ncbi:MAG TPA: hypothetical protein VMZ50_11015 [Phycisphaerae bacterium]|nr:hypothetical protein [Phycisphaerae bacterium]